MSNAVLTAALGYAAKGLPVFPVNPRTKKPYLQTPKGSKGGFHQATTDTKQIEDWWRQYPDAMIGVPTGERSGFWISDEDIDQKKGIDGCAELAKLIAQNGPLPPTRVCITPRGGRHHHWQVVGQAKLIRNSTSKIAPGIDVRGIGGYAVIPPSVCANGTTYRWEGGQDLGVAPDWLVKAALEASRSTQARRPTVRALAALAQECEIVANSPPGKRNDALNVAAFNLGQLVASGELDEGEVRARLFEAAEQCGLVADDGAQAALSTITSGMQAGLAQPRARRAPPPGPPPGLPLQPRPSAPHPLPTIRLTEGELPRIVDEAERALIASRQPIYQRGNIAVRVFKPTRSTIADDHDVPSWQIKPLDKRFLVNLLTRIARFEKMDARARAYVRKNCPDLVAETYLSLAGHWKIPPLLSVTNCPFLRPDGSLCQRPGYDQQTAILFIPGQQTFPTIAATPTLEDAREALKYLDNTLLKEFPFVNRTDHSVAFSLFLTALDRQAMPATPIHGYTSPIHGTGKSLLVRLASIVASGASPRLISQGQSQEDFDKAFGAALIAGYRIISFDNCERELGGSLLCQAVTEPHIDVRELGFSRLVEVPNTSLLCATGNNLEIAKDSVRRTLFCRLDAGVEQPELRSFERDVVETAYAERTQLVAAGLTILRAWHAAKTAIGVSPLGSFE